ncbi:hypothetical protein KJ934_02130 [Patescibacteria group bacterium]|nr:hypothetical protein [Patescibacteria group bacterium]
MKKVLAVLILVFAGYFIFIVGVGYGRQLEREIGVIKAEDVDQTELQRWEVRYAARGLES